MVTIKVCGLTRVADATLACELGAQAIGLVFWDRSPRAVGIDQATEIVRSLPRRVMPVGVFVNADPTWIGTVVAQVGLRVVQLHGDESAADCEAMPVAVLKAVPLRSDDDVQRALDLPDDVMPLVDVHDPERRGGTGLVVDWNLAARVARRRPTFLAGGLDAANIDAALDVVQPYGIDVSSSLESSPGVKDPTRLRTFFAAVHKTVGDRV